MAAGAVVLKGSPGGDRLGGLHRRRRTRHLPPDQPAQDEERRGQGDLRHQSRPPGQCAEAGRGRRTAPPGRLHRLEETARAQGHRRGGQRPAGLPPRPVLPGHRRRRQGHLRRKAALHQLVRMRQGGQRRPEEQGHLPGRLPAPRRPVLPRDHLTRAQGRAGQAGRRPRGLVQRLGSDRRVVRPREAVRRLDGRAGLPQLGRHRVGEPVLTGARGRLRIDGMVQGSRGHRRRSQQHLEGGARSRCPRLLLRRDRVRQRLHRQYHPQLGGPRPVQRRVHAG